MNNTTMTAWQTREAAAARKRKRRMRHPLRFARAILGSRLSDLREARTRAATEAFQLCVSQPALQNIAGLRWREFQGMLLAELPLTQLPSILNFPLPREVEWLLTAPLLRGSSMSVAIRLSSHPSLPPNQTVPAIVLYSSRPLSGSSLYQTRPAGASITEEP